MATPSFDKPLQWIDGQRQWMLDTLRDWAETNSCTHNPDGLAEMERKLSQAFASLAGTEQRIELESARVVNSRGDVVPQPLGRALLFTKRPNAPLRVLLNIHYDTVYPPTGSFQRTVLLDPHTLRGPGVADAKGGILVMLTALAALERSEFADRIGWEVLLNPDEEIGSPGSAGLLAEAAKRNHLGLVYEPALPDGMLVGARKGSGIYTAVVHGKAAHAGRNFEDGRSAILALAELIRLLEEDAARHPGIVINCGQIEGGGALNVVPDLAIGRFNVRAGNNDDRDFIDHQFRVHARGVERRDGIRIDLTGGFHSPPKPLDDRSARLMNAIIDTGQHLGLSLVHRPSGGTCDGNKLAAAGLPVVDSLGPVGGELHSEREYVLVPTLTERAKLSALLLLRLATGELPP